MTSWGGEAHEEHTAALFQAVEALGPLTRAVRACVDYSLPPEIADRFVLLGEQMNLDAPAPCLARLNRDWLIKFRTAVLDSIREGVTASAYHADNVRRFEAEMIEACLANLPEGDPPSSSGVSGAPGSAGKLNYEYQAFRLGLRRTLDYLATAVANAFKCDRANLSRLEKTIAGCEPADVRSAVVSAIADLRALLDDVLARPSARDQIAHWGSVAGGVLNVFWQAGSIDISLAGGGENLVPAFRLSLDDETPRVLVHTPLSAVLDEQLRRTTDGLFSVLEALGLETRR